MRGGSRYARACACINGLVRFLTLLGSLACVALLGPGTAGASPIGFAGGSLPASYIAKTILPPARAGHGASADVIAVSRQIASSRRWLDVRRTSRPMRFTPHSRKASWCGGSLNCRVASHALGGFLARTVRPRGARGRFLPPADRPGNPYRLRARPPNRGASRVHASSGTWSETTGGAANTWTNYTNAGGYQGPTIGAYATVQIACRVQGFAVADGNTWWYQVASSPWNSAFYVSADA